MASVKKLSLITMVGLAIGLFFFFFNGASEKEKARQENTSYEVSAAFPPPFPNQSNLAKGIGINNLDAAFAIDSHKPRKLEARRLLALYKEKYLGKGIVAQVLLDNIRGIGLEKNAENFKSIKELLSARVTQEERVSLTKILADFYGSEEGAQYNAEIKSILKDLAYSGTSDIGRAAILAYSRLGYFDDSLSLMGYGKTSGYISDQDYYGDLAHLLPYASGQDQEKILSLIKSGQNTYSVEVLTSIVREPGLLEKISPLAVNELKIIISANEPKFPDQSNEFGLFDAVRYTEWLKTTAALNGATNDAIFCEFINAQLNSPAVDPRKLISFLMSPEGARVMTRLNQNGILQPMYQRIALYADQNHNVESIQEAVADIKNKISHI